MSKENLTKAVLIEGRTYIEQSDGSYKPAVGKTDFATLAAMTDKDVEKNIASDPNATPVFSQEWLDRAELYNQPEKSIISMRVDNRIIEWFKQQGKGYQTRMNNVLRAYVDTHLSR